MLRIATRLVTAAAVAGAVGSCGGSDDGQTVLVLAASSLTDAFTGIEVAFEADNPGVDVEMSYGGSSTLRVQVEEGAPAAVVAFADVAPMEPLIAAELVGQPSTFAANSMILATPIDNPGSVSALDDLADPDLLVGVCAPQVPCGRYALDVLAQAGVDASIDTEEPDVRALAAKVATAELDAGLIYVTDAAARPGEIAVIALPDTVDVVIEYPIALVTDDSNAAADSADARSFVDFVLSTAGREILTDAGFETP